MIGQRNMQALVFAFRQVALLVADPLERRSLCELKNHEGVNRAAPLAKSVDLLIIQHE